ncbi:hypothetical protein KA107_03135 [Candidatus Pacearchaeota archaeon]|nr:hypothetical protein [Candidatus Pacearchaeota archaeon]
MVSVRIDAYTLEDFADRIKSNSVSKVDLCMRDERSGLPSTLFRALQDHILPGVASGVDVVAYPHEVRGEGNVLEMETSFFVNDVDATGVFTVRYGPNAHYAISIDGNYSLHEPNARAKLEKRVREILSPWSERKR